MPTKPSDQLDLVGVGMPKQLKLLEQKFCLVKNVFKGRFKMKCLQCNEVVTNADYELANSAEIVGYACSSECVEELWHNWSVN